MTIFSNISKCWIDKICRNHQVPSESFAKCLAVHANRPSQTTPIKINNQKLFLLSTFRRFWLMASKHRSYIRKYQWFFFFERIHVLMSFVLFESFLGFSFAMNGSACKWLNDFFFSPLFSRFQFLFGWNILYFFSAFDLLYAF